MTDPLKEDFRNFFFLCMKYLDKTPDELQYDVAQYLQHGPDRRGVTALRGFGKSYITAIFADWLLYCDPNTTIMCVSGNTNKAADFMRLSRKLIDIVPELQHLRPLEDGRDGAFKFETGARTYASKDPSISAYGITGMITGSHVDHIIADDVETPHNSETVEAREKLLNLCLEFESVINKGGTITYLGTPQSRESIYNILRDHYQFRRWPARYPDLNNENAMDRLSPILAEHLVSGKAKAGDPTCPERFGEDILQQKEAIMGPAMFSLQMLLDTSLADANKYPLKLKNFIVHPVTAYVAPERIVWGKNPIDDIQNVGLKGDHFNQPIFYSKDKFVEYQAGVMFIDPAGSGNDEVGWCVAKVLNGTVFIQAVGGLSGGHSDENLIELAKICKMHSINRVVVEKNFGDGAFAKLLAPVLAVTCGPVSMEDVGSGNKQKEKRIIEVLEPLLGSHRIVIPREVAEDRVLMCQISNITDRKDSLKSYKDDRIEAMAGACKALLEHVSVDPQRVIDNRAEANRMEAYNDFMTSVKRSKMGRKVVIGSLEWAKDENKSYGSFTPGRYKWGKQG